MTDYSKVEARIKECIIIPTIVTIVRHPWLQAMAIWFENTLAWFGYDVLKKKRQREDYESGMRYYAEMFKIPLNEKEADMYKKGKELEDFLRGPHPLDHAVKQMVKDVKNGMPHKEILERWNIERKV